jgi:cobyrinic acid a,c-diamide synthase
VRLLEHGLADQFQLEAAELFNVARAGLPRIVIAGLAGDTGKSLVSLGLARALTRRGWRVAPFKKGPDFIDAAWLGEAAGAPGRNLDTYFMTPEVIARSVQRAAHEANFLLVEGNRGLFDGADAQGTHSTAQLAKQIGAPVILVVNAVKVTRTVAALVLGCKALDPELSLAGVVLNRLGTGRQESVIRRALETDVGVPVLGAIPKLDGDLLPSRHLGLVCAAEHPSRDTSLEALGRVVGQYVDLESICAIASEAPGMAGAADAPTLRSIGRRARIGVLRDAAFSFYYPENLEALEDAGADLVFISPLRDRGLPPIDALYAGGGFPEEYAAELAANETLRAALREVLADGLPAWAECGGLMYLSRCIRRDGREHPMVGALPAAVEHTSRPQGHGYAAAKVDRPNPFFAVGTRLLGHEFHYSKLIGSPEADTAFAVERGSGLGLGREGLTAGNIVATYMHLHALGMPEWAPALVQAAHRRAALVRERTASARAEGTP